MSHTGQDMVVLVVVGIVIGFYAYILIKGRQDEKAKKPKEPPRS